MNNCVGLGVDIESIDRFRKINYENNFSFYDKLFTTREIEYCLSCDDSYPHFAVRFCAKEAFIKAIDTIIEDMRDIEICMKDGKPVIIYMGKIYNVSLSHNQNNAIAVVIIIGDNANK